MSVFTPFPVEDRLAIHALVDLYGHILDDRAFDRAGEVFTADARYDVTDFGMGVVEGLAAIVALWTGPSARHPLAHHATNILVTPIGPDRASVRSKGLGVNHDGQAGSIVYQDEAVHTDRGWRLASRIALLRRSPAA